MSQPDLRSADLDPAEIEYPSSDGEPMAETDTHRKLMCDLIVALEWRFRDEPDVYVSGNLFLYFERGVPSSVVAPDVFVVRGAPKLDRDYYLLWEEPCAPQLVVELTSKSTHREDLGKKRRIYSQLGVREYFLFDPRRERDGRPSRRIEPPLQGFFRDEATDELVHRVSTVGADGRLVLQSEVLGLELRALGRELRWWDPLVGAPLAVPEDLRERALELESRARESDERAEEHARRAEEHARRAEEQARRAEESERKARANEARALESEAENARLREELARLRGEE